MLKELESIIQSSKTKDEKLAQLDAIILQTEEAKDIINGKMKYCADCKDYYNAKSFFIEQETKHERICIYEDPINSGGNEYVDGEATYTYEVCPKNHRHCIDRIERK